MNGSKVVRVGGIAAMTAGIMVPPTIVLEEFVAGEFFTLMAIFLLLLAVAVPGFHVAQQGRDGRLGTAATYATSIGAVLTGLLIAVGAYLDATGRHDVDSGIVEGLFLLGMVLFSVGIIVFAVTTARSRFFPRRQTLFLVSSLVFWIAAETVEQMLTRVGFVADLLPLVGLTLFGASLFWLGYTLFRISHRRKGLS